MVEGMLLDGMAPSLVRNKIGAMGLDKLVAERSATKTESGDARPPALLGVAARMSPVGYKDPAVNAQARLVGLKLDTLGSLLTSAARTDVGGTGKYARPAGNRIIWDIHSGCVTSLGRRPTKLTLADHYL